MEAVRVIAQAIAAIASETRTISGMLLIETCLSEAMLAWPFLPIMV
jgi:hypothetical protein